MNYNDITKVKDMETLNLLKESFDTDYKKQKEVVETLELAKEVSGKKFGFIKESFENISPELFKSKEGRGIINKYIACIKENDELKKMHLLYECVRKAGKDVDVNTYLNEAVSMVGTVNPKSYKDATNKIGEVLAEAVVKLGGVKYETLTSGKVYKDRTIDEAIDYIGTHKKTAKTLPEFTECFNTISEQIHLHESVKKIASFSSLKEKDIEKAINEFNEKYGKELDESGQSLVRELMESKNKEDVFNKYKETCINSIKEKQNVFESDGDTNSKERLGIILEKINKKTYNPETVNTDIFNLVEMANSLE